MDKLKHFINSNRQAFDGGLLPEGHFERFDKKLPALYKKCNRMTGILSVVVAAAIALFVVFNIQHGIKDTPAHQSVTYSCETQQEIDELRFYYNMQMGSLYAQMRTLYKSEQTSGGLALLKESKQVIKSSRNFENNVLPELPRSEAGLFAINQHYNASLESLNIMLYQMELMINTNNNNL
jgi:hypothetical protein